jgi:hypothetical protein
MKACVYLIVPFVCLLLGCDTFTQKQQVWVHIGEDPIPDYANFYETFDKYPDYAIAEYRINESYNSQNDTKHLQEAISLCRATFKGAYEAKNLQRPTGSSATFIFWIPRYVLFAIQDVAGYPGSDSFDSSYKVAYIIPAEMVFSNQYDFQKAFQAAYIDRTPFHFDRPSPVEEAKGWSPAERYKWLAIERHEAHLNNKATDTK